MILLTNTTLIKNKDKHTHFTTARKRAHRASQIN